MDIAICCGGYEDMVLCGRVKCFKIVSRTRPRSRHSQDSTVGMLGQIDVLPYHTELRYDIWVPTEQKEAI